jgi:hypothetical protein
VVCLMQERRSEKSGHFAVDMRPACILETSDANGRREGNRTRTALPGASHQVDLSNLVMHAGYICDRLRVDRECSTWDVLLTVCWTACCSNHARCSQGGTAGTVCILVVGIHPYHKQQTTRSKTGRVKPVRRTDILEDRTRLSQGSVGSNSESISRYHVYMGCCNSHTACTQQEAAYSNGSVRIGQSVTGRRLCSHVAASCGRYSTSREVKRLFEARHSTPAPQ